MKYLYAFIPCSEARVFDAVGACPEHVEGFGSPDRKVYALPQNGIAAVVSDCEPIDFKAMPKELLLRSLVAHQRVVEAVHKEFDVLPVKFGTMLSNEAEVQHLLSQGQRRLKQALEEIAGKVQMEVVVTWDLEWVFKQIAQQPEIAQRNAALAERPKEETLLERVELGKLVKEALEQRRAAYQSEILSALKSCALDCQQNPLMDDRMVANVGLLIRRAQRAELEEKVHELDWRFDEHFHFKIVGPLPPYSFATVYVQKPTFKEVDAARRRMGLKVEATMKEIKNAYRQLAQQLHPDKKLGKLGNWETGSEPSELKPIPQFPNFQASSSEDGLFIQLTKDYQLLRDYCINQSGTEDLEGRCCFSRQATEKTFLLSIRRVEAVRLMEDGQWSMVNGH